jgi:hypothetical protein
MEPYIPTKMEWLITELEAAGRHEITSMSDYALDFASPNPDTVFIVVLYPSTVDRQVMNIGIESARKAAEITIKGHGWENWVKIKERVQMATPAQ